jgi:hypothetical protein
MKQCPQCGSKKVFPGNHHNMILGMPPHYFRPRGLKLLVTGGADVPITHRTLTACADCGLLWTTIDPLKLQQVLRESGNKATRQKLVSNDEAG